jgi:hypothetical protein
MHSVSGYTKWWAGAIPRIGWSVAFLAVVLGVLWIAVDVPKLNDQHWFTGQTVANYLTKAIQSTGPSDRPRLWLVDDLIYGGMNRAFAAGITSAATVATAVFLSELATGLALIVGGITGKAGLRRGGTAGSIAGCLLLGLSGASRLTAVLFVLAIALIVLEWQMERTSENETR